MKKQTTDKINKKENKNLKNNNYGITLISLVVTIIVLLILAGISISMLSGNNSILSRVTQAKDETEIAEEKETIKRAIMQSISKNKDRKLIQSDLQLEIGSDKANVYDDGDGFTILFKSKRIYTIDKERNIGGTISKYEEATKKFATEIADKNYGTEEKPYEINCIEDLVELSYKVNGIVVEENGTLTYTNTRNNFSGKNIVLTKNLNYKLPLSYEDSTRKDYGDINGNGEVEELLIELTTGTGWIPIGGNGQNDSGVLSGSFNGNNNSIVNLYINNSNEKSVVGLFGKINSAIIENINIKGNIYCNATYAAGVVAYGNKEIKNCSFNGKIENVKENIRALTAGIIAYSNVADIEKCHFKGEIVGRFNAGGILGSGTATISESYNEAYLFSESNDSYSAIGGIAANGGNCEITDCYNTGNVEGPRNAGGITGGGANTIERCNNSGNIISRQGSAGGINGGKTNGYNMKFIKCYNTGKVEGKCAAGICGYNWVIGTSIFDQCYNLGKIIGGTDATGGITGHIQVEGSQLCNCYNFGKITGTKVAGIAWGNNNKVKVISCYNLGELNGATKYSISYKGNIGNCYYLTNCGIATENAIEVTDEELKNLATTLDKTYTIDDENNTITINENTAQNVWKSDTENKNEGYPIFMWQE